MVINKYQWELYLKSGGLRTIERFRSFLNGDFGDYPDLIYELTSGFCPDKQIVEDQKEAATWAISNIKEIVNEMASSKKENEEHNPEGEVEQEPVNVIEFVRNEWSNFQKQAGKRERPGIVFGKFTQVISDNSHMWAFFEPRCFFPYLFTQCFFVVSSIADIFHIDLPPIPGKTRYSDRVDYYGMLCNTLIDFANENNFKPEELWAFLYDYAPKCAGGLSWVSSEIPDARNAYVFGYGPAYPENDPDRKWLCQGNPDMQPGDIGVLYHWAPDSCYTSIWRAISPGFYDPLASHDRYVCYGNPIIIPRVTYDELKDDQVLGKTELVKQKMHNMDGAPMLPSEYMRLLELVRKKGNLPTDIPTLDFGCETNHGELLLERDVEMQLLEPMLLRLGWKPENWCRQMSIRIGRGVSKYPDYVINPIYTKYNERGDIVLEAKLSIPNAKQVEHDRGQAHSYAKLLGAFAYVLVAREGIWIAERSDDFTGMIYYTWKEMEDDDTFTRVYDIIGNKKHSKR